MKKKTDIKSMNMEELAFFVEGLFEKPFRAKQLYQWMHQKQASSFDEMTNLSAAFREKLKQECICRHLELVDVQASKQDGTRKYLFRLKDGHVVESVFMRYKFGASVCISSQAGCRMGCKFCASAIGGFARNLSPSEMLEQVYQIQNDTGERITRVTVMGTGEPLDNYDSLLAFIKILTDENGLHIGQRNVTVSTCGIVPGILKLADEKLQITLALSLHAPSQNQRKELMPVAEKYELDDVIAACRYYFEKTGRRVTFEYALAAGVNDRPKDADMLARLLFGQNCHINLIPANPVKEWKIKSSKSAEAFKNKLEKYGINVTIRREMGRDIDAACGQLRKKYMERHGGEYSEKQTEGGQFA